uniref:Uncharacterized protein n=1 Tax=Arundo donax TaxID=35708 RepID=A0A0A8ZY05_ARUDO
MSTVVKVSSITSFSAKMQTRRVKTCPPEIYSKNDNNHSIHLIL